MTHAAVLDGHAFPAQSPCLLPMLHGCFREHDASTGTDYAMPGEMHLLGRDFQRESGQPCATGQSSGARDGPIGRYFPAGNHANHVPDRLKGGIVRDGHRTTRRRLPGAERQEQFGKYSSGARHAF
jgi:hypothetical protein